MRTYQKQKLEKLCKFIRNINKSSVPNAVSHPCLCCVYTVYMFISILYLLVYYMYVFSVPLYMVRVFVLWCLTPLSAIFQLHHGGIWFMIQDSRFLISHETINSGTGNLSI
jgi:hypothetical protein